MIALHAVWIPGSDLRLWAENGAGPLTLPRRRGRRPARPPLRAHPFALSADDLASMLVSAGKWRAGEMPLLLPSHADGPAASPELLLEDAAPVPPATSLARWKVGAVEIDRAVAGDLLLDLDASREGVRVGASLVAFATLARRALGAVARGRVVPALIREDGAWVARWRPHPGETEPLAHFAQAMPPACRAEATAGEQGHDPHAIVRHAFETLVDAFAREGAASARGTRALRRTSGASAWTAALRSTDAAAHPTVGDPARLAAALDLWRASADGVDDGAFRTCFRLAPPPDEDPGAEPWRLSILVQATDDPTLVVPAEEIWSARGSTLRVLSRVIEAPQERLLGDLGRAVRLYPELDAALRTARPSGIDLGADGAHTFLRDSAPLLVQAGFGVVAPSWWGRPASVLGLRLRVRPKAQADAGSGLMGADAVLAYDWEVALGGETLTLDELRRLAAMKVPLVRARGRWVELDEERIRTALEFLEREADGGEMAVLDALRVGVGLDVPDAGLPVVDVVGEGWAEGLLAARDRALRPMRTPKGFRGSLRPYQRRGLAWLSFLGSLGLGACLADDMGLGKTVQLLALLVAERAEAGGASPRPTLLVCPMSLVGNWQREAARFAPTLRVHVHHGAGRLAGDELLEAVASADLVLTTFAICARDAEALASVGWWRVVVDEAQNVKNAATRQARAVRALPAGRRVAMTGTPVENRLTELWSIMEFLNPGLLGSERGFRARFAVPIESYGDENAAGLLRRLTRPFLLRRVKTDRTIIRDLPDKLDMKVFCNLTREQASLYQAVVDDMLRRLEEKEGIERRGLILATLTRLKQVCNHPAQFAGDGSALEGRSGKLARLEEILEEVLAEGEKALVFTQFAEMGGMLRTHLQHRLGREVLLLHGGVARGARDEMVARFQAEGGPPAFVLSLKAGGTGLNLTAASHVVHFDRWWNPAVEDQATDRAFRIGQRRDVQVRKLVAVGTLEERIDELIERKKALAERIVGTGEGWLTELSTEDLRKIVALSSDAVAEG
jgi:non-specific serine/threonine protein kinase